MKKVLCKKKLIIKSSIILFVLLVVIGGVVGNYFYNLALNPNTPKEIIFGSDSGSNKKNENWILDKSNYKDSYIVSEDGLKLHAYEINNKDTNNVWIISVHGYTGEGRDMDGYVEGFYKMGYNLLVPDLRGHGFSEGEYIGMGWDDRIDILKWIDYINSKDEKAKIILHGISMGAATVMMVSGG